MDRPLTRAEKNRRAMNGLPMNAPRSERRKDNDRKPMIDLDEQDRLAELELAAKEKSRHQAKLAAAGAGAITGIGLTSGTGFFVREMVGGGFLGMPEEYAPPDAGNKVRRTARIFLHASRPVPHPTPIITSSA